MNTAFSSCCVPTRLNALPPSIFVIAGKAAASSSSAAALASSSESDEADLSGSDDSSADDACSTSSSSSEEVWGEEGAIPPLWRNYVDFVTQGKTSRAASALLKVRAAIETVLEMCVTETEVFSESPERVAQVVQKKTRWEKISTAMEECIKDVSSVANFQMIYTYLQV